MLVAWYSCTEEGKEDLFSEHEGELLFKGHKWTATNFLYQHHSQCSGRQLLGNIVDHFQSKTWSEFCILIYDIYIPLYQVSDDTRKEKGAVMFECVCSSVTLF